MKIVEKANIKEFVALVAGGVAGKLIGAVVDKMQIDQNQKTLAKVGIGLAGAYLFNDLAEKYVGSAELFSMLSLAMTAVAAQPVTERLNVEISALTKTPIVISRGVELEKQPVVIPAPSIKKPIEEGISIGR